MRPAFGLLLLLPTLAAAQDYDAGARLNARLGAIPVGGQVSPRWLDGGRRLVLREGSGYRVVDAHTGASTTQDAPPTATDLIPGFLPARSSGPGGPQSDLTIVNRSEGTVDVFWVDGEGHRTKYGTLRRGETAVERTYATHAWLLADPSGTPLVAYVTPEGGGTAVWTGLPPTPTPVPRPEGLSPDGKTMVTPRTDGNLWFDGGGPVTHDGRPGDRYVRVWWSPDGRYVATMREEEGFDRRLVIRRPGKPTVDVPYRKPGDKIPHPRIAIYDVRSGEGGLVAQELAPNPWDVTEVHWSRDSRELYYAYDQRGHGVERLLAADAATRRVRTVVEETSRTFIDYSQKRWVRYLDRSDEALWASERSGFNHLYLVNLRTGALKAVTQGPWTVRSVELVDEGARSAVVRVMGIDPAQDPYQMHFVRVGLDGGAPVRLTQGDGTHRLQWARDGLSYLDVYSRVDLPPVTELHAFDGRRLAVLAKGDDAELKKAGWAAPERFVAKGRDGKTDIYGIIHRPSNFDPAKRYPVIESIYAGPHDFFVPKEFSATYDTARLTELGFVVVQIDGMGTNWRSRAFHDVAFQNLADAGFPDRILWMRAAAKTRPWMDLDRVGVFGTSAGGQSAASAVLRFGDFYKAAVADCGCHDNRLDKIWWNEAWMGWPVGPAYAANSNANPEVVKGLKRPLYLMVGDVDTNVDPVSTQVVVDALRAAGKPYELLVVEDSNHGVLSKPGPYRKMQEFFVRELKP